MNRKWFKIENIKGVRYYEHSTRIYKKRKDRNFILQYKLDKKVINESLGCERGAYFMQPSSHISCGCRMRFYDKPVD